MNQRLTRPLTTAVGAGGARTGLHRWEESFRGQAGGAGRADLHQNPLGQDTFFVFFFNVLICGKFLFFTSFYFLAALGLCCCARAFSSCGECGLLFVAVHGLLIAVASLVAKHGL